MLENIVMRCGPQVSVFEVGAWKYLEEMLLKQHVKKALVIHGKISWEKFAPIFPEMEQVEIVFDEFHGECTYEEAKRIARLTDNLHVDAIISVGGGKNNDCVKMAGSMSLKVVAILPTLAATCAAWTPVCVMYNDKGEMVDFPILNKATDILLVDFAVILDSPLEYMRAGIGDTLAKWYESDVIIRQLPSVNTAVKLAHYYANMCFDNIKQYGIGAMEALENSNINEAFINIIETNIMLSGMVGGFGDRYARTAGAHSLHDALTLLPQTHQTLHGNKVAYGILIQLILEQRVDEVDQLLPFYEQLQLPKKLAEIGISKINEQDLTLVATRASAEEEDIHLLPEEITVEKIMEAMLTLEKIVSK